MRHALLFSLAAASFALVVPPPRSPRAHGPDGTFDPASRIDLTWQGVSNGKQVLHWRRTPRSRAG